MNDVNTEVQTPVVKEALTASDLTVKDQEFMARHGLTVEDMLKEKAA